MNANYTLASALAAGIAIGAAGVSIMHAQEAASVPAYYIADVDVTDDNAFQRYAAGVPGTLAPFNGHYLIRGGKVQAVEGEAPKRFVVIAFDNADKARGWYNSAAYEAIKPIRHSSAKTRSFIVDGTR